MTLYFSTVTDSKSSLELEFKYLDSFFFEICKEISPMTRSFQVIFNRCEGWYTLPALINRQEKKFFSFNYLNYLCIIPKSYMVTYHQKLFLMKSPLTNQFDLPSILFKSEIENLLAKGFLTRLFESFVFSTPTSILWIVPVLPRRFLHPNTIYYNKLKVD